MAGRTLGVLALPLILALLVSLQPPAHGARVRNVAVTEAQANSSKVLSAKLALDLGRGGHGRVVINEVFPMASSGPDEWVEIYNPSLVPVDLSGWRLMDTNRNLVPPLSDVLPSGGYKVYHMRRKLRDTGDEVILLDSKGVTVDRFRYSLAAPGMSFARKPSGGLWAPGPQQPNQGGPNGECDPRGVVLNEVMPLPVSGDEWIELHNVGCMDVDLASWQLLAKPGDRSWVFRYLGLADKFRTLKAWDSPTVIEVGAYVVVDMRSRLRHHGDSLRLLAPSGEVVDSFIYAGSVKGKSWRRAPRGGDWVPEPGEPTRGTANPAVRQSGGPPPCGGQCGGLCFGTWNIQNLGVSKGSKPAVMKVIRQVLSRYDLVAIQELSQIPRPPFAWCGENTGDVICDSLPDRATYSLKASPRVGDEQYVIVYRNSAIEVFGQMTYPDPRRVHSRPPHVFGVQVKQGSAGRLAVAVTHTTPKRATEEIRNFPQVTAWMEQTSGAQHFLIAGDFNADGSYFADEREWPGSELTHAWPGYAQLTDNSMDTTVAPTYNTYDRIVVDQHLHHTSEPASSFFLEDVDMSGIFREGCSMGYLSADLCSMDLAQTEWHDFPEGVKTMLAQQVSDHHPVEACLGEA